MGSRSTYVCLLVVWVKRERLEVDGRMEMASDGGADDDEVERPALSRPFNHVGVALIQLSSRWRSNAFSRG